MDLIFRQPAVCFEMELFDESVIIKMSLYFILFYFLIKFFLLSSGNVLRVISKSLQKSQTSEINHHQVICTVLQHFCRWTFVSCRWCAAHYTDRHEQYAHSMFCKLMFWEFLTNDAIKNIRRVFLCYSKNTWCQMVFSVLYDKLCFCFQVTNKNRCEH